MSSEVVGTIPEYTNKAKDYLLLSLADRDSPSSSGCQHINFRDFANKARIKGSGEAPFGKFGSPERTACRITYDKYRKRAKRGNLNLDVIPSGWTY